MSRYLFLAFTVVPLLELYLLLSLGRNVGVLPTVALVLCTGLLGAVLARQEGLRVLRSWQSSVARGRIPEDGILSGALVLLGGALLIAPGVITDATGLLLLVPPTRRWVAARIRRVMERRMRDGTVRFTTFRAGGFGPETFSEDAPASWPAAGGSRHQPGEVDAEFIEDGSRRH